MCGISGELRFDNAPVDIEAIERMMATLARRGPDNAGIFSDGPLGFGHRRLAVIDLSANSDQPLIDHELKLALVFNGTIYNYRELRLKLIDKGYRFFSEGDSEVILKAYRAWGEACVERFNGMFAFSIWDMQKKKLFLARDRVGIKPLYYSVDEKKFRFASSLQAILATGGIDTSFDSVALHHHLTLHGVVPGPRTILQGVRKLPPATTLSIEIDGKITKNLYWQLDARRPDIKMRDQEWVEATDLALTKSIQRQSLAADVPVGILLSGGLDSSLLVALAAKMGVTNLLTFSIGFEDVAGEVASEFEYSDQVATKFNTNHHKLSIANSEVLKRLPEAVANMSEPMAGQDAVAFYLLAEQVSKDVKVVLSGQGADEVFGGYFWYPLMEQEQGSPLNKFRKHYFDRSHQELLQVLAPQHHMIDTTSSFVEEMLSRPRADTFLDQVLRFDVTTLIVDDPVKRVDNMTMAWGLEARVPFLDHELIELAAQMPPELKLREGGKYPLKAMARGLLPDAVIDRPKGYFPLPALKYVRGEFFSFMHDILTSQHCRNRGLFQRTYVDKMLAEPDSHFTAIKGNKLWHLALLELWLQLNVDV